MTTNMRDEMVLVDVAELEEKTNISTFSDVEHSNKFVSFIVGLSAFFIFKLLLMIPLNLSLVLFANNMDESQISGLGGLFLVVTIYFAVKYTKRLNKNASRKSRNIKRVLTIVVGFFSMLISTVILNM